MIFFETAAQASAFLLLLYAGFAAGLLYDLLGVPRRLLPPWAALPLDVLWCLAAGAACAAALALGGESRARLFALLGLASGAGIYCLGVRALFQFILRLFSKKDPHGHGEYRDAD